MTVPLRAAIAAAAERLDTAGVPSPRHDAEELAAYLLGVGRRDLWRHSAPPPGYQGYVERRAAREPLQHLTGRAFFRHVELAVGPGVFIPRPETELVAGVVVEQARRLLAFTPGPVVVDLATGSGAIALAVASEVPGTRVHAVELDERAHDWARRNLQGTGVELRLGDLADAYADLDRTVDVVVSNPPYIPVGAVVRDVEVAVHDPPRALWAGPDGLDAIRAVEASAARLLRPGGLVVVEHADLQGRSAPEVFIRTGRWTAVTDCPDLAGRPRYLTARRKGSPS